MLCILYWATIVGLVRSKMSEVLFGWSLQSIGFSAFGSQNARLARHRGTPRNIWLIFMNKFSTILPELKGLICADENNPYAAFILILLFRCYCSRPYCLHGRCHAPSPSMRLERVDRKAGNYTPNGSREDWGRLSESQVESD